MNRLLTLALATTVFASTAALAANATWYSDWDRDGDEQLSADEMNSGISDSGAFDQWDTDGDGSLSKEEFGTGLHESWDTNDDGNISDDEWNDDFWGV